MTAATLFTPKITPQFGADPMDTVSADTGWDSDALDADESINDIDVAEQLLSTQNLPTETMQFRKLQKKLRRQVSWAIRDFNMIEDGDVVMVCVSGGKDSYTLLDILLLLKRLHLSTLISLQ